MGSTGIGKLTPFVMKAEIWHEDTSGWSVGKTSVGDIYLGTEHNADFFKDTPENRKYALEQWKVHSHNKEVKK